jgi:myo-inositol-1(or 4)-monophosphatase
MAAERELLSGCAEAVAAGAAELRARWGRPRTIDKKGAIDLVTDADRASEAAVLSVLRARFPGAAILAEESGASGPGGAAGAAGAPRFYVDPLDGTTNYAHGVPHFAVTVGAADGAGLAAAATCDPLRGETFLASRGGGATLNGVPIRHAGCAELSEALLATGFPYDVHREHEALLRGFAAVLTRARGVRRLGAAALDLAYVACGRYDAFWEMGLSRWDMAAGTLMIKEAGGLVADFSGDDQYLDSGEVVAATPKVFPQLLKIIQSHK